MSNSFRRYIPIQWEHSLAAVFSAGVFMLASGTHASGQATRWAALRQQAVQLENQGNAAAALPLEQQAAQVAQATWGPQDLHLAVTLNALGIVDQHLEKFSDAETNLKQALAIFTNVEGAESKNAAPVLNNLGTLYLDLGRYADADKVTQQALAITIKLEGENNIDVATTETNLAIIFQKEDKYAEAETYFKKSIATDQRLGDAAELSHGLKGLGLLYTNSGKYAQAEELAQQQLAAFEKAYGPQDPRIADVLNDLGTDFELNGKLAEAEQTLSKALVIAQKAPSPDQSLIGTIEQNLGGLLRNEGKYPQAESLMFLALNSRAKALGPNHPDVASVLSSLGLLYEYEMRFSDAERATRQALDIDTKALGPGSVATARMMVQLAHLYGSHGEPGPAEQLYVGAIRVYLPVTSQAPRQVASVVFQGAQQFLNDGNLQVAASLFNDAGGIYRNAEGDSSLGAARCLTNLGAIAEDLGKRDQAEGLQKKAIAVFEKVSGPDTIDLIEPLAGLARTYKSEKRFAEVEPLYQRALKIDQAHFKPNNPNFRAIESDLAALYFVWDKPVQAAPYFHNYLGNLMDEFRANAPTMSERERLNYFATQKLAFPLFFNFVVRYHDQMPELTGQMYDALLEEKGLIASSAASMRAAVVASGDPQAVAMLDKLSSDRAQMAALMESTAGRSGKSQGADQPAGRRGQHAGANADEAFCGHESATGAECRHMARRAEGAQAGRVGGGSHTVPL